MDSDSQVNIVCGYRPGVIGRIAELHGTYYAEHWAFGCYFEAKVASEFSEFLLRYDDHRDGIWVAVRKGRVEGSLIIDGLQVAAEGAHLRWFILSNAVRGKGVGRRLIQRAMKFCDDNAYPRTYLWTFEGLDAARHLYEEAGFKLMKERIGTQWGTEVKEQYFERTMG